jgi:hypothetical protein
VADVDVVPGECFLELFLGKRTGVRLVYGVEKLELEEA